MQFVYCESELAFTKEVTFVFSGGISSRELVTGEIHDRPTARSKRNLENSPKITPEEQTPRMRNWAPHASPTLAMEEKGRIGHIRTDSPGGDPTTCACATGGRGDATQQSARVQGRKLFVLRFLVLLNK